MREITIRRPVVWESALNSHVGMVREVNEDATLSLSEAGFWAVADGMGGYEGGNVASRMVVTALEEFTPANGLSEQVNQIEDRLLEVNRRILEYADIMLEGRTLGSTVVSLLLKGFVGVCMWVGDSRLYRLRNRSMVQLSRDHSQLQEQIEQGYITAEDAQNHPDSNVITRAVGAEGGLYVDINVFSAQSGDTYLLCSDGLYNMVSNEEIAVMLGTDVVERIVKNLVQLALDRGADDNVSAIVVRGRQAKRTSPRL